MARNYFSLPLNACHLAIRIVGIYKLKFQKKNSQWHYNEFITLASGAATPRRFSSINMKHPEASTNAGSY